MHIFATEIHVSLTTEEELLKTGQYMTVFDLLVLLYMRTVAALHIYFIDKSIKN